MDWFNLAYSGLVGGIGGALGVLFSHFLFPKSSIRYYLPIPFVLAAIWAANYLPVKNQIRGRILGTNKYEEYFNTHKISMVSDELVMARLASRPPEETAYLARKFAKEGIFWLTEVDVDRWSEIRQAFLVASPAFCESAFKGTSEDEMSEVLKTLHGTYIKSFFELTLKAMRYGIANENRFPTKQANTDLIAGMKRIYAQMPPQESTKLSSILNEPAKSTGAEGCWALKKLHDEARKLPDGARHRFLRAYGAL